MMDCVQGLGQVLPQQNQQAPSAPSHSSFGDILSQVRQESIQQNAAQIPPALAPVPPQAEPAQPGINFSKHAISRAEERGIELTPALMEQLAGSVEKAQEKGAKNILAFNATQAFIINVPYGRVITTLSQDEMKENIFTYLAGPHRGGRGAGPEWPAPARQKRSRKNDRSNVCGRIRLEGAHERPERDWPEHLQREHQCL